MGEPLGPTNRDDPRKETRFQRSDRNWSELLQEFRVAQTGIQVIFGFLLILPFQARFGDLSAQETWLYLAIFACMAVATICILAPVVAHRLLFRRRMKEELVDIGNGLVKASLLFVGLALAGAVGLVVGFVVTPWAGWVALGAAAALTVCLWLLLPLRELRRQGSGGAPLPGNPSVTPPRR